MNKRVWLMTLLSVLLCSTALADSRLDRILVQKKVRVCIWPEYYGITYRDPRTQALSGIDYEMALALGQDLGVDVQFIDSHFAGLITDVLSERCDVAMFAIGITPERQQHLAFTEPHLASDIYAISTRTSRRIQTWRDIDQKGVIVAVARGTLHEPIMQRRIEHATLSIVDTPFAREQEVRSGRADVFITDYPYSKKMLDTVDWARLIPPEGTFHITPYAYAIRPGDPAWLARLNEFVAAIRSDGRLNAVAERLGLMPLLI